MRSLGSGFDCLQDRSKGHSSCSAAALTLSHSAAKTRGPVGATRSPDGASR
jgi:hypothetical protein